MYILGISAFYHDAAAALTHDGNIIAAVQEERFSRIKHDERFPVNAVKSCLDIGCITMDDIEYVVFYDKPFLKFERLLETYLAFAPRGLRSFIKAMPVWLKQKLYLKKVIRQSLESITGRANKRLKILFTEHHLSHAASAYFPSPFDESAIVSIDGVGEWATTSICRGIKNDITVIKEVHFPHSVGLLYSAFTFFLGFQVNSGEYKLMGLAPYGNPEAEETRHFVGTIKEQICKIFDDGSIYLNQDYFTYATGLKMVDEKKWERLFGLKMRTADSRITQAHCNLAMAIQQVTEEIVTKIVLEAKKMTGSDNLCLAGGVALNCVINGKLQQSGIFKNIYVQPAAGDAGGSVGAALAAHHIYFGKEKIRMLSYDGMNGSFLGPQFHSAEILKICRGKKIVYELLTDESILQKTASLLQEGNIVGWFQGRMEFGPRALGNRSILADPGDPDMQKKLNLMIKFRESFRPFAPAIPIELVDQYFELNQFSPYMLFVHQLRTKWRKKLPENYSAFNPEEKLQVERSVLPAITHVDFSSRIQTVHQETNPRLWHLLMAFQNLTGYPVLVNTSFNVRDEPIVCSPAEAIDCFMKTEMDVLVLDNILILKKDQNP